MTGMNNTAEFEYSSKTGRVTKNVTNSLKKSLVEVYGISPFDVDKVAHKILKVHGMAPANFDVVKNVEQMMSAQFKQDTTAGKVDENSNKGEKSIKQIFADAQGSFQKLTGYDYLYRMMKQLYGTTEAKRLSGELYSYALSLSDSTQILSVYCYAADFSNLVMFGRPWGLIHSAPAKRVDSYVQQVLETVHEMSNHLAGAIAISTLFFDMAHLIMYKEGINSALTCVTLDEVQNDTVTRKCLENIFQTIIHSVNHTSRNGAESPFTNVSIFDRTKIRAIMDTIPHLFQDNDDFAGEVKNAHVIELVHELQNIYMDIFEKGNQLKDNRPVTFPVSTLNLTKREIMALDENGEVQTYVSDKKDADGNFINLPLGTGKFEVVDVDYLDEISQRDMYRYNVNVSAGNRVAMCCFDGAQEVLIKNSADDIERVTFKDLADRGESELSVYRGDDKWREATLVISPIAGRRMYTIKLADNDTMTVTGDHLFPVMTTDGTVDKRADQISSADYIKCDYTTFSENTDVIKLISGGINYIKVMAIDLVEEYAEDTVYCFGMKDDRDPYFTLPSGIVTHNCRFSNNYDLMREQAATVNSFGGEGISIGSHRVNTINLKRVALEATSLGDFRVRLDGRVRDAVKVLKAHKELIKFTADKGLQKFISNGWIKIDNLFSTIGIIATAEMKDTLRVKFSHQIGVGEDWVLIALDTIESSVEKYSREFGVFGNIEEIPGESMAAKLPIIDKLLFGDDLVPEVLYSNQFVPLWKDATIYERMEADGKYQQRLTGGGIAHFQVDTILTPVQNKNLVMDAVEVGCEHFAANPVTNECSAGHNTVGSFATDKCPIPGCGCEIVARMTRVVGFQTEVNNWNETRRNWEAPKRITYGQDEILRPTHVG